MAVYFAEELTAPEFADVTGPDVVAVLPVAAIEPHGPHLPLSTDCDIARGHLGQLERYVGAGRDVLVLPLQTIGYSQEHSRLPGVFSHDPEILLTTWVAVVEPFCRQGGRRIIIVSSHGGNSEVVSLLATRMRASMDVVAVSAAWMRFGQPQALFSEAELDYGIHGGDIETSLMLHYRPDAVRQQHVANFPSSAMDHDAGTRWLTVHGKTRMGWLSRDLNPHGVVGNAAAATAEKGAASAEHALRGFAQLIDEVALFDLERLE